MCVYVGMFTHLRYQTQRIDRKSFFSTPCMRGSMRLGAYAICGVFVVCGQRIGKKAQKSRCTSSTYRIKCDTLQHVPKNVTQSNRTACGIFAVKKFSSQWSCPRYSFLCRTKIHLHCHLKEKLLRSCGPSQRENVRLDFSLKPTSLIDFVMEKSDSLDRSRPS